MKTNRRNKEKQVKNRINIPTGYNHQYFIY